MLAADAPARHQPRPLEHPDVLGDGVQGHRERARELRHPRFTPREAPQDRASRWIGERDERVVITDAIQRAADAAELFVREGIGLVMNRVNRREEKLEDSGASLD